MTLPTLMTSLTTLRRTHKLRLIVVELHWINSYSKQICINQSTNQSIRMRRLITNLLEFSMGTCHNHSHSLQVIIRCSSSNRLRSSIRCNSSSSTKTNITHQCSSIQDGSLSLHKLTRTHLVLWPCLERICKWDRINNNSSKWKPPNLETNNIRAAIEERAIDRPFSAKVTSW